MVMAIKGMADRLRAWLSSARHRERAWAGFQAPDERGLTKLQDMCLCELKSRGLWESFEEEPEGLPYLHGRLKGTPLEFYLYADGAEIVGESVDFRLERWDFEEPQHLIDKLSVAARQALAFNKTKQAGAP